MIQVIYKLLSIWLNYFQTPVKIDYQENTLNLINNFLKLKTSENTIQQRDNGKFGTLFRNNIRPKKGIDLSNFNGIININNEYVEVGGSTPIHDVMVETLKIGKMPPIIPELRTITVGGAISGVGIESSSCNYGWFHNNVIEFDVLLASGKIVTCRRDNQYQDLFFGIPNSYGTLGYILKAKLKLIEVKPFVKVEIIKFEDHKLAIDYLADKKSDFKEGVSFQDFTLCICSSMSNICKNLIVNPLEKPFYQLIQEQTEFYLTIYDYIWRWDSDMFWGTRGLSLLNNPLIRKNIGRSILNSNFLRAAHMLTSKPELDHEKIIQDIGIPYQDTANFLIWLRNEIQIYPIWICPVVPKKEYTPLWKFNKDNLLFDIAIFGSKKKEEDHELGKYNKSIEKKMLEYKGMKCFYSDTFFTKDQFNNNLDNKEYLRLKNKYDSNNLFQNLYDKCIKQ